MKQLLILSGKGGTGKTSVAAAFIKLAGVKACADCDVDAPNLHLAMGKLPPPLEKDFYGLDKAMINPALCTSCGICMEMCAFNAICEDFTVDPYGCEGCGLCMEFCPEKAIEMVPALAGKQQLHVFEKVFSTARLETGSGNSGLLVMEVKKWMRQEAGDAPLALLDGSPGLGCPVIASLSGTDMVLVVTEPSVSGLSDMERILTLTGTFHMKVAACINKYDLNPEKTLEIEEYCIKNDIFLAGTIPYDPLVAKAMDRGLTAVDIPCPGKEAMESVYHKTMEYLYEEKQQ
ncbi:MAG: ATP-binding protein [Clostridia bacterium]